MEPNWTAINGAVAVVALLQPHLVWLWRRYILKPTAQFYPSGSLEVGLTADGPVVAVLGTLRAKKRELFITRASLIVERQRDHSTHEFDWFVFRLDSTGDAPNVVPARGLMVEPRSPQNVSIVFRDIATGDAIRAESRVVSAEWDKFRRRDMAFRTGAGLPETPEGMPTLWDSFSKEKSVVTAHTRIGRENYWSKGEYTLTLRIASDDLTSVLAQSWAFELTETDEAALSLNAVAIVARAMNDSRMDQNRWVYPAYCS